MVQKISYTYDQLKGQRLSLTVRDANNNVKYTDSYAYSPNLDYLIGAAYTGTPTIPNATWTYDARDSD
jgi:hypothetical protein